MGSDLSGDKRLGRRLLGREVGLDLFAVRVVVGERRMHLGQRQVPDPVRDLLGAQPELVPAHDPPDGHPGAGDTRPVASDLRAP